MKQLFLAILILMLFVGLLPTVALAQANAQLPVIEKGTVDCDEDEDNYLCNGVIGVEGEPFCDKYSKEVRTAQYPAIESCFARTINSVAFCERYGDLGDSISDWCRKTPGSKQYFEYMDTGGPDMSCLFDVYQLKCNEDPITGECPENFGHNEDNMCFPDNQGPDGKWGCPDGYHTVDEDESGQCYSNSEGCPVYEGQSDYVLLQNQPGKSDQCAALEYYCDPQHGFPARDVCKEFLQRQTEEQAKTG
jgi:hypothetical protein